MSTLSLVAIAQTAPPAAPHAADSVVAYALLAAVALVPLVLTVATSFVKISVVLGIVRNAFGSADIPNTLVVTGLAIALTLAVMAPTFAAVADAAGPHAREALEIDPHDPHALDVYARTWDAARAPMQRFLHANSTPRDRALFVDLAARNGPAHAPAEDDLTVLVPAFAIAQLTSAFALGFLLLLPFLVLEIVIANILTALGLQNLQASTVSLPFKLLLFVLADGWYLVARALLLGYR